MTSRSPYRLALLGVCALALPVAGCATKAAVQALITTLGQGIALANAVTLYTGQASPSVAITVSWTASSGLNKVTRNGTDISSASTTKTSSNNLTDTDSALTPDATYSYALTLQNGATFSPSVMPLSYPSSAASNLNPNSTPAQLVAQTPQVAGSDTPTLSWGALTAPDSGYLDYLVSLGEYNQSNPSSFTPLYAALIDGTKDNSGGTVSIKYGSPSDVAGISTILSLAASSSAPIKTTDGQNIPPLTSGKQYAWTVVPVEFSGLSAVSVGKPSLPAVFQAP